MDVLHDCLELIVRKGVKTVDDGPSDEPPSVSKTEFDAVKILNFES